MPDLFSNPLVNNSTQCLFGYLCRKCSELMVDLDLIEHYNHSVTSDDQTRMCYDMFPNDDCDASADDCGGCNGGAVSKMFRTK